MFDNEDTGDGQDEVDDECGCEAQNDCDAQWFLIDGQVAWSSASAPARLPNIFNGLHSIVSQNESKPLRN